MIPKVRLWALDQLGPLTKGLRGRSALEASHFNTGVGSRMGPDSLLLQLFDQKPTTEAGKGNWRLINTPKDSSGHQWYEASRNESVPAELILVCPPRAFVQPKTCNGSQTDKSIGSIFGISTILTSSELALCSIKDHAAPYRGAAHNVMRARPPLANHIAPVSRPD